MDNNTLKLETFSGGKFYLDKEENKSECINLTDGFEKEKTLRTLSYF